MPVVGVGEMHTLCKTRGMACSYKNRLVLHTNCIHSSNQSDFLNQIRSMMSPVSYFLPPLPMCGCCDCGACKAVRVIVSILLLALTVAAFIGVWTTHMTPAGWVFGTTDASLAILAGVASLTVFHKTSKKLCRCSKSCGVCPACGNMPCTCKK